jgi:hypothetical protein
MKPIIRINWIFWNEGPLLPRLLSATHTSHLAQPDLCSGKHTERSECAARRTT